MLDVVGVIGGEVLVFQKGQVLFHHLGLPAGVQHRQAVGLLVGGHLPHRGHPRFKQRGHLPVHLVDGAARLFQFVHPGDPLFCSVAVKYTINGAMAQ